MITRISEIIHERTGWCPNAHALQASRNYRDGPGPLSSRTEEKIPARTGGAKDPRNSRYEHTQRGTLIIGAVSAAIIVILAISSLAGFVWIVAIVLCIMVFVLAISSTLTVSLGDEELRIRFGPVGLIRKSWPLSEIVSVKTVTNPWYYGWGIRWTPHGTLYNVSGSRGVEILLSSGKTFRIGTDEPEALKAAIDPVRHPDTESRQTGRYP
jgi:hypothetical protein